MTIPGPVHFGPDAPTWRTHSCVPCWAFEPDMSVGAWVLGRAAKAPTHSMPRAPHPTILRARLKTYRHECRYGTQECVRHVGPSAVSYAGSPGPSRDILRCAPYFAALVSGKKFSITQISPVPVPAV